MESDSFEASWLLNAGSAAINHGQQQQLQMGTNNNQTFNQGQNGKTRNKERTAHTKGMVQHIGSDNFSFHSFFFPSAFVCQVFFLISTPLSLRVASSIAVTSILSLATAPLPQ
jgi:VIT1/CCC1 family predicted Fe2+/Mn2+ transporter